jgi:glutamyl-tRNA synthetase
MPMALPKQPIDGSSRVTRLAPSPTGALHLGNARTFLVTWAIARRLGWRIVLRIEDLDTPRVKSGAAEAMIDTLRWLGIDWDPCPVACRAGHSDGVLVQSRDLAPYRAAMTVLARSGRAYPCALSRAEIESAASAPQEGSHEVPFPSTLRPPSAGAPLEFDSLDHVSSPSPGEPASSSDPNWRFITPPGVVEFDDQIARAGQHGVPARQRFDASAIVGDFVLWTKRAQPSYQLAVVVDDHRQGVTDVIRGDDLLDSAARQLLLYRALGYAPEPRYWHLPLVIGTDGRRLAKRHGDTRVETYRALGVPPEALIGLVARWTGIVVGNQNRCEGSSIRTPMSADAFSAALDLATIPRGPVTFIQEDDQWLRSQARSGRTP